MMPLSDRFRAIQKSAMRKIIVFLTLLCVGGAAQAAAETLEITTTGKPLQAVLYRPEGNGPFPAIVALHDCDGLRRNSGRVRQSTEDWGRHLSAAGFVVVFPDSFASRGLARQCSIKAPSVRPDRERTADAHAARNWLQQQNFIRKDRITLLGWGSGGVAVLWAVRPSLEPDDNRPDFRSAAALYPGCRRLGDTAWSARIPTLILIGALDNWTPAKHCEQMVKDARGRSAQVSLIKYKAAHHAFDHGNLPAKARRKIAFAQDPSGRATVGTNAEARADALKRVPQWLAR
jgi:dienelactone hydrolase